MKTSCIVLTLVGLALGGLAIYLDKLSFVVGEFTDIVCAGLSFICAGLACLIHLINLVIVGVFIQKDYRKATCGDRAIFFGGAAVSLAWLVLSV
jgi:hypothetical protein